MDLQFQIGSDKFKYIYRAASDMVCTGNPVYYCSRGLDDSQGGFILWLVRDADGHWQAKEAPDDCKEPARDGKPVFRTKETTIDDITQPGDIDWQWWNKKKSEWKDFDYTFKTKIVGRSP